MIAVTHSAAFLLIAVRSFAVSGPLSAIWLRGGDMKRSLPIVAIYATVTAVLLYLSWTSRNRSERLYFGLCATSAGIGMLGNVLGDSPNQLALLLRIVLLSCAVVTGITIVRFHSELLTEVRS